MGLNSPKMEAAIEAAHQRLMKMPRWKIKLKLFLIRRGWFGHGFWYRSLRHANLGTKFSKGVQETNLLKQAVNDLCGAYMKNMEIEGTVGSAKLSVGVLKWFMRISKL